VISALKIFGVFFGAPKFEPQLFLDKPQTFFDEPAFGAELLSLHYS
jgi:hypothetical protein